MMSSWAFRRRFLYITAIGLFFLALFGGPAAYKILTVPATCFDGKQNQGETAADRGGPCILLDERLLQPYAVMWARGFRVRDGTYNAVAYIQNPNEHAGVESVPYHFKLYDENNVLVAERNGTTYIMPGGITPVIESHIDTGFRIVAHTYFEFTAPLAWKSMKNRSTAIAISGKETTSPDAEPNVKAQARNTSVDILNKVGFVAVVFDQAGNAFQASATAVETFYPETSQNLVFTWPDPFTLSVGHVDVMPAVPPVVVSPASGR